jgi:ribosomal-protein-alanine N-acetyltransferase
VSLIIGKARPSFALRNGPRPLSVGVRENRRLCGSQPSPGVAINHSAKSLSVELITAVASGQVHGSADERARRSARPPRKPLRVVGTGGLVDRPPTTRGNVTRMSLPTPTLQSARLRLRPFDDTDANDLFALHSNAYVLRFWDAPPWSERVRAERFITACRQMAEAGTGARLAVDRVPDGAFIGWCSLNRWNPDYRSASLGYCFDDAAWGRGYATEAARLLPLWAFDTLDLNRVQAETDTRNVASARVLEKLGFVREGTLREDCIVNGELTGETTKSAPFARHHPPPGRFALPSRGAGTGHSHAADLATRAPVRGLFLIYLPTSRRRGSPRSAASRSSRKLRCFRCRVRFP